MSVEPAVGVDLPIEAPRPDAPPVITLDVSYSQDDEAALLSVHDTKSPQTLHANQSFERGTKYWGTTSTSELEIFAGGQGGNQGAKFKPASTSSFLFQTVDYTTTYSTGSGESVDAKVKHKRGTGKAGDVKVQLRVREIEYDGTCNAYDSGLREWDRDIPSANWTTAADSGWDTVTTSWQATGTFTYSISSSWDAAEVRVRLYSTVKGNNGAGSLTWIKLDELRARER